MPYAATTFGQAKTQLSEVLGDPSFVFWSNDELGVYIIEALRTWGAAALYWRERGTFNTTAGVPFYNVRVEIPTLLGDTILDTEIVKSIQYKMCEPATGNSWTGTDMFTLDQVTQAIQRRRNQFRLETGMSGMVNYQIASGTPANGRVALNDRTIDVRRVAFQEIGGTSWVTLWRSDEWAMGAATANGWAQTPAKPSTYSVLAPPPLTLQLAPVPQATGTLDLLTIETGLDLNPAVGVILGIPDDFAWVIEFGAMCDLLGPDAQTKDSPRAAYCQARWEEGVALGRIYASVVQMQVNAVPIYISALQSLDAGNPTWQASSGQPTIAAAAGLHVFALSPVPDGSYGISADVVRKAPIPAADGDFLQIGREELDSILRYAEHLASFKMGGAEFAATKLQYDGFIRAASIYNERLRANASNFEVLTDRTHLEGSRRPRRLAKPQPVGA